ncbi:MULTISPECIES: hypothetical protein [Roseovarius]|nr:MULTISPECIES: hypothetical protein [Roseovarius]MAZ19701.1 hypothetical protein [Roseovarius sp.]HAR53162.1 hypothetical protein [Roseovarius nubinhibens]|tara:strand:- start:204 stop:497 length:294 start_codon:yes stop_codon:yes gene_type:complete
MTLRLLTLWALLLAPPALADATYNGKTVDCYCTDSRGDRQELGDMICLQVDGKMFMAQCQMSLNVPMWRKISDGCLSSALPETPAPFPDTGGVDAKI